MAVEFVQSATDHESIRNGHVALLEINNKSIKRLKPLERIRAKNSRISIQSSVCIETIEESRKGGNCYRISATCGTGELLLLLLSEGRFPLAGRVGE